MKSHDYAFLAGRGDSNRCTRKRGLRPLGKNWRGGQFAAFTNNLEYCAPVFHHSLPAYLCNDIERVQRRALSVIAPASSYHETLSRFNLCTLKERRSGLCEKLFTSIKLDKEHKLHHFLPDKNLSTYSLRKPRSFKNFKAPTNRFKNTFFPAMTII